MYISEIERLKRSRRAVILAHNYQLPEVQDVADFVGDSLELAIRAREVDADVIVMAGVRFMAEMVAALNPDKIVLHPNPWSGCPLADFINRQIVNAYREKYRGSPLVVYVNSPIDVKAVADYVVTSSSAVKLISRLESDTILFGPDKNLADHVSQVTGRKIVPVPPGGHCPVHEFLLCRYYAEKAVADHPGYELIVHPEVPRDVRAMAKFIGSTSQMLNYVRTAESRRILIGTEEGLVYRARKMAPDKEIEPVNPRAICINMKKITPRHILESLESLKPRVVIDKAIASKAREVIEMSIEMVRR